MNVKKFVSSVVVLGAIGTVGAQQLMTVWGEKVTDDNCWRDYPRPQMMRENWQCLNGAWDYTVVSNSLCSTNVTPIRFSGYDIEVAKGRIRVPFAFEAPLSGVGRLIQPHETMIYRRSFKANPRKGFRTLLNFEGVDLRSQIFVNGVEAMDVPHMGSETPFSLDVTDLVRTGDNELKVVVFDPTDQTGGEYGAGKQSTHPKGCFYTRVSGIWQTVWMEEVPETYIEGFKVVTDIDARTVTFQFQTVGKDRDDDVEVAVFDANGKVIAEGEEDAQDKLVLKMPKDFKLWSPETPNLYSFTAKIKKDLVKGYFGMRKIERRKDAKGIWRFFLNNKPYYLIGTLDQGWWPDGLLTPPSSEACAFDIKTLKDCGFNMMRKHIKVEPRIYYHLCDKLGLIVLQDMPSGSESCLFTYEAKHQIRMENRYAIYRTEWKGVVDHLYNVPSIVMWIPYNEGWMQPGERLTHDTLLWTKRYDPTRLVNGPSGWNDYEGGDLLQLDNMWKIFREPHAECNEPVSDCNDRHDYEADAPKPLKNTKNRIAFLGEFGGLGLKIPGHLWDEKNAWGYIDTGKDVDPKATQKKYLALMEKLAKASETCYSGSVYTQTTDVECEINGLLTYDRKVLKYDAAALRAAHAKIRATVEKGK